VAGRILVPPVPASGLGPGTVRVGHEISARCFLGAFDLRPQVALQCGYRGPLQPGKSAYSRFGPYSATLTASSSSSRLTGVATPSGPVRVQVPVQVIVYTSCR
jgi:hypothetical protein